MTTAALPTQPPDSLRTRTTLWRPSLRDVASLVKPRVTALVLITSAGGLWLAPGSIAPLTLVWALLGIATVVGAANSLNCWLERDVDRYMVRTAARPLPAGRMDPRFALGFGLGLAGFSLPLLTLLVNPLTGLLGAFALLTYVALYTPLKRRSPIALWLGAVPGALPPLMGWTAKSGALGWGGLTLFAILFFWQLPHFLAIASFRREDYARAGLRVLTVSHGERSAQLHAFVNALALVWVSVALFALGLAGPLYLGYAVVAGTLFAVLCGLWGLQPRADMRRWARIVFFASLIYLTLLFVVIIVDGRPA